MATLTADQPRVMEHGYGPVFNELPVIASDIIYDGAAVGLSSGNCRPLVGGDTFVGFAEKKVDNSAGSAGDKDVLLRTMGIVELDVAGVTGVSDHESIVYASDDNTFTLTSTSNSKIGRVHRWISGTKCMVRFKVAD